MAHLWEVCGASSDQVLPGGGHKPRPSAQDLGTCPLAVLGGPPHRVPEHCSVKVAQRNGQLGARDSSFHRCYPALALRQHGHLLRINHTRNGLPATPAQTMALLLNNLMTGLEDAYRANVVPCIPR